MIIVDYIPNDGLAGKGHYRLQDEWIRDLVAGKTVTYTNKLTFFKFIKIGLRALLIREACFFPNMSLYDRNSLFNTLLILFLPFSKKTIILHSVSKIDFLNRVFMFCARNCRIYTYSDTLRSYMSAHNRSKTNNCYVARYKNADLMYNLVKPQEMVRPRTRPNRLSHAIIWGNPVSRLDEKRLGLVLDAADFTRVTIVSENRDALTRLAHRYAGVIEIIPNASDLEIARYLSTVDVNIMCFDSEFDFYKSKKASSGVYLTSLRFGIPTIAWFDAGDFGAEIETDGLSIVITCEDSLARVDQVLTATHRSVKDAVKRYEIELD